MNEHLRWLSIGGALLGLASGCGLVMSYDGYEAAPGAGVSTGAGGTGAGAGGDGGSVVCDGEVEDDGNECTMDVCSDGAPAHPPAAASTPCGNGSDTHCDGAGKCVGCTSSSDCPSPTGCTSYQCESGQCKTTFAPSGMPCGSAPTCAQGVEELVDQCNDAGVCVDGGTQSCQAYACGQGACLTSCANDSGCASGYYCSTAAQTANQCLLIQSQGDHCLVDQECSTGHCVDAFCCESACTATCNACASVKTGGLPNGLCFPVATGTDPDNECPGNCSNGTCVP